VFVLFGSAAGICALLGLRLLLKQHSVRRFVRSMKQRLHSAQSREDGLMQETVVQKGTSNASMRSSDLQKVHTLVRQAEKTLAQQKTEEAEKIFIQALTIQPSAHDVRAQLAKLYLTTHREPKAEALYKELVHVKSDVSYYANLGLSYYRQGKYEEARLSYQSALEIEPKVPERQVSLGRACIASGHFEEAADLLQKASTVLSRNTDLLRLLADCYVQLQDRDNAKETYARINKIEPYDEEVKEKMLALARA
jgi:tetratricopeptide (TPR) repeat protein